MRQGVDAADPFELTETVPLDNAIARVERLRKLKHLGVTLVTDDLAPAMPASAARASSRSEIDWSFVRDMPPQAGAAAQVLASR